MADDDAATESLLLLQAQQEITLLREELSAATKRSEAATRTEFALQAAINSAEQRAEAARAERDALKVAVEDLEKNFRVSLRTTTETAQTEAFARVSMLEQQLAASEEACEALVASRLREVEAEAERLRERCAAAEGRCQAAAHAEHELALRADVAEAKAERLQQALDQSRAELSQALDEGRAARVMAERADASERAAAERAQLKENELERRALEAESRMHAAPAERDEAIANLRRAFREASSRLHERATAIITREVRLRMVAEEKARIRALDGALDGPL